MIVPARKEPIRSPFTDAGHGREAQLELVQSQGQWHAVEVCPRNGATIMEHDGVVRDRAQFAGKDGFNAFELIEAGAQNGWCGPE